MTWLGRVVRTFVLPCRATLEAELGQLRMPQQKRCASGAVHKHLCGGTENKVTLGAAELWMPCTLCKQECCSVGCAAAHALVHEGLDAELVGLLGSESVTPEQLLSIQRRAELGVRLIVRASTDSSQEAATAAQQAWSKAKADCRL
jgi:hypothetical protein